jgi:WD40 repeat protein
VTSVAVSPDGRRIASGSAKHSEGEPVPLKIWDRLTGHEVVQTRGNATEAFGVAFSPDSRWIVTGDGTGDLTVWDAETGHAKHVLPTGRRIVFALAFSPVDHYLAALSSEGTVIVYDSTRWQEGPLLHFQAHQGSVRGTLAFSPDGQRLVVPGDENTVIVWDTSTFAKRGAPTLWKTLHGHTAQVWGVACSANAQWIASGGEDLTVKIWDATTGGLIHSFPGHTSLVSRVAFSPDSQHLASASFDGTVKLWDMTKIEGANP